MLISTSLSTYSQSVIIYDFNKGDFNKPITPVQTGSFMTLKIKNINTFRYKVEISGLNIDYVTQIPSELQTIFRLPKEESTNTTKTTEGLKEGNEEAEAMKNLAIIAKKESDDAASSVIPAIAATAPNKKNLSDAMKELSEACQEYIKIAQKVGDIKFLRAELINLSKHNWENHGELAERLPPPRDRTSMKRDYNTFITSYAKAYSLYSKAKKAANLAKDTEKEKEIEEAEEKLEESNNKINEDSFLKLIEDIMILQEALQNKKYFEVISAPIQMDGDYMEFIVKITPVQTNDLMPFESEQEFPVLIPAKGGLKVDFSVGPVVSFGNNSKDCNYYFKAATTDTTLQLLQNKNSISPSIAAMMHFYRRSGRLGSVGGLFGVGAGLQSVEQINFNLYFGLSAVLGKSEKIMLNSGISYLRVARLKEDQFKVGGSYRPSKVNISDVIEKVFKPSFFLSISYNLTRRVEKR